MSLPTQQKSLNYRLTVEKILAVLLAVIGYRMFFLGSSMPAHGRSQYFLTCILAVILGLRLLPK
ncbi:MAG: hypothetical protein EOP87_09780, partial [Verrucomicrobiaceae bacterium]